MTGIGLYIVGTTAGIGAYAVGRAVLRFRDFHRDAIRTERNYNVVRLLTPYEREIRRQDDLSLTTDVVRAAKRLRAVDAQFDQAG